MWKNFNVSQHYHIFRLSVIPRLIVRHAYLREMQKSARLEILLPYNIQNIPFISGDVDVAVISIPLKLGF